MFDPIEVDLYFLEEEIKDTKLKIAWLKEQIEARQETLVELQAQSDG